MIDLSSGYCICLSVVSSVLLPVKLAIVYMKKMNEKDHISQSYVSLHFRSVFYGKLISTKGQVFSQHLVNYACNLRCFRWPL